MLPAAVAPPLTAAITCAPVAPAIPLTWYGLNTICFSGDFNARLSWIAIFVPGAPWHGAIAAMLPAFTVQGLMLAGAGVGAGSGFGVAIGAGPGFTTGTTGVAAGGGSLPPTTGCVGVGAGGGSRPPTTGGVGVGAG